MLMADQILPKKLHIKRSHLAAAMALTCAVPVPASKALAATHSESVKAKPNIVFMLADDLGYGDVHCLNPQHGKIATPNIDQLASQGITFTNAHADSSVCTPSRYGLMTGRYAWRTRLQKGVIGGFDPPLIKKDQLTVAELLKEQGYTTACLGKWHLGFTINKSYTRKNRIGGPIGAVTHNGPTTRGFDYFLGYQQARTMKSVFQNDRLIAHVKPVKLLPMLTSRAVKYIFNKSKSSKPFFLYFALDSPHIPLVPSKRWRGKSGDLGRYGDYVMETDWAIGQVLNAIHNAGISNNTVVFFASDNGCASYIDLRRLLSHGHYPSAQFRGYKTDIWDGGNRVPLMVRWPGKIKAGIRSNQLVCLNDFMATCAAILHMKLPPNAAEDSFSFLPALTGKGKCKRTSVVLASIKGDFALRQGPWKLELCAGSGGRDAPKNRAALREGLPPIQLYNMRKNPGENINLEADYPQRVREMTRKLTEIIRDGRSTPGPREHNAVHVNIFKGSHIPKYGKNK